MLSMEHFLFRNVFGEEKTFDLFKKAGFDGVDFSFNMLGNGTAINLDNHIEKAMESKRLLDKYNLICNQSHAPFAFKFGEEIFTADEFLSYLKVDLNSTYLIKIKSFNK